MNKYSPPDLNLQIQEVAPENVNITELRREFRHPFAGNVRYMDHVVPEWINEEKTGVRVRVFNGGYDPEDYYYPSKRYCLGIVAVRDSVTTHFLGEIHKPLPKSNPYRFAIRLTPAEGQVVVKSSVIGQLDLLEDNENVSEVLHEKDDLLQYGDIDDFRRKLSIIGWYSIFQKAYTLPQGQTSRQGANFELVPALAREKCQPVDLNKEAGRMNAILYS